MDKTLSIIIPCYNVEKYIDKCVESLLNQDYKNIEVILVDDGSTDGSGEICDAYSAKYANFRVIHKTNSGPSPSRNVGINEAHGQWLIFLDSDDVWSDPDCLQKLYSYATKLNLDVVRFEVQTVNERLEYVEPYSYDKSNITGRVIDNYELVKYGISGKWFTVLFLLRKDIIKNLRFNELINSQEDIDFYSRLFASRELRCGYLDERMYLYRKRAASITTTARINNLEGSFSLCDVFFNESTKIKDKRLKHLYIYYSVINHLLQLYHILFYAVHYYVTNNV